MIDGADGINTCSRNHQTDTALRMSEPLTEANYRWTELTPQGRRQRRNRTTNLNASLVGMLAILFCYTSQLPVCHAEAVVDGDDFYDLDNDTVYTAAPTTSPPTFNPTPSPTTLPPTLFPTETPTATPTVEPTRAGDDFYEVQIDDYTAEAQSAEIYISSISDVVLCLLCTFFWVLWLVGTIFPTKIQHLYKTEGIVVTGDVLESYVTHGEAEGPPPPNEGAEESASEFNGGDTFDALNNLPTYNAIVSYVVPGPIASGRRRKRRTSRSGSPGQRLSNNYYLQQEDGKVKMANKQGNTVADSALEELTQKLSIDHVKASMQVNKGTPPRPPKSGSRHAKKNSPPSPHSPDLGTFSGQEGMRNRKLSKISEEGERSNNQKSLLDSCTKSFETTSMADKKAKNDEAAILGFYKYNCNDANEYVTGNSDLWEEEYENPELIGNIFHSFGLSHWVMKKEKPLDKKPSPVRVKKRFETNELLKRGTKNVEIIVLPGNPGSGILKTEFELEEDYLLHGTVSAEMDGAERLDSGMNEATSGQMGDVTAGMIGVVLSAVSVIGAVHGALTLPYQTRACKFFIIE